LQPWHFIVIADEDVKASLKPHTDNQPQTTDASHLVVLCMKTAIDAQHVDRHIRQVIQTRGVTQESLQAYRERLLSAAAGMSRSAYRPWAANQVYLAAGILLATAAYLHIDACPMEGFDAKAYDKVLNLKQKGLHAVLLVAMGYRSESDQKAKYKKVRFDSADVISTI
jgi:nitroreductase